MSAEVERAKRFAAEQVALGLDRTMVSSMAVPARMAQPAVGADYDEGRLVRAIDNCGRVCEVLQAEGLRPLHHSHVGGVFETEDEIVRLLDDLGPDVLGFGPDTGHLRWAGIEPAPFIRRYADRMGGIHIKDCFPDYLSPREPGGHELPRGLGHQAAVGRAGQRGGGLRCRGRRDPRRLRRRLHDRGGRAERGVQPGVAPHLVRVGAEQPSGGDRHDNDGHRPAARRPDRRPGPDAGGGGGRPVRRGAARGHRRRRPERLRAGARRHPGVPAAPARPGGSPRPARAGVPAHGAGRARDARTDERGRPGRAPRVRRAEPVRGLSGDRGPQPRVVEAGDVRPSRHDPRGADRGAVRGPAQPRGGGAAEPGGRRPRHRAGRRAGPPARGRRYVRR